MNSILKNSIIIMLHATTKNITSLQYKPYNILFLYIKETYTSSWNSPLYEDEDLMHLVIMLLFVQVTVVYRTMIDRGPV